MKCPLLVMAEIAGGKVLEPEQLECAKEECEVWQRDGERCGLRSIDDNLDRIADYLKIMLEKMPHDTNVNLAVIADVLDGILQHMPHEGQFRK